MNKTDAHRSIYDETDYHKSAMICLIVGDLWASIPKCWIKERGNFFQSVVICNISVISVLIFLISTQ